MDTMRESWTDARLDDFAENTNRRFDSVERRMENGFSEMNRRFDAMDARFDGLQQTLLRLCGAFAIALIGLFATLIVTQL
jgi:hypothetical protein